LGVLVPRRLQRRLQRRVHRGGAARGRHRIQLPPRARVAPRSRRSGRGLLRGHERNGRGDVLARAARHERVRPRGRRRLPRVLHLLARAGWPLGHVPVARPRTPGAQREGRHLVAPSRRVRQALSRVMASERAFFGVAALLFTASAALTTRWCTSMSAMSEMPMPGGWSMSMVWMRMPGQTWPGAAASFLGMWVVMMVAMMMPSLVPMLWRYRQALEQTSETRLDRQTALVGVGYFFVWTAFGVAAFPLGVVLAELEMR